jgi:hypothetical protein
LYANKTPGINIHIIIKYAMNFVRYPKVISAWYVVGVTMFHGTQDNRNAIAIRRFLSAAENAPLPNFFQITNTPIEKTSESIKFIVDSIPNQ